jgi:glycine/D-amino acid oxidase-like deaminating enzyme
MQQPYDVLILGSGPIGAATAYFLAEQNGLRIGVVTQDPTDDHSATYTNAGGSLRWFWDDELKTEMTKRTADFLQERIDEGVDLMANNDHYLFMHRGKYVPSLNFSGAKAVNWFLDEAEKKNVTIERQQKLKSVTKDGEGYKVVTDKGEFKAKKVLLALGTANQDFMPNYELEVEKRELFVLDLPVNDDERDFPHVVLPVEDGVAYVFIKETAKGWRFIVGQEDVVETSDEAEAEDYYEALLKAGLGKIMPFLSKAKVEQILWGFDVGNKELKLEEVDGLFAANCGSAARACVYLGQTIAERLTA